MVAAGGAVGQGIPDHGLLRNGAVSIHAVEGAAGSARIEEDSPQDK